MKNRNVSIIRDTNDKKIVVIHDILFMGKRQINWKNVEKYLKQYIGEIYTIVETQDLVYIGKEFAEEYGGSKDTAQLKGTLAKAKANAASGIPELIEIATKKRFKENFAGKHRKDAKYGWYRLDSRFAIPVYNTNEEIERYNVFHVEMLIRHDKNRKLYLYDIVNIKKEPSTPPKQ